MAGGQGSGNVPDERAITQLSTARQVVQDPQVQAVNSLYWRQTGVKHSARTPVSSTVVTPAEPAGQEEEMEVEQDHNAHRTVLLPVSSNRLLCRGTLPYQLQLVPWG